MMVCDSCSQEVRFGWRDGNPGWWHREGVDHTGRPVLAPVIEEIIEIPDPEIPCHPVSVEDFPPRSGIRTTVSAVLKNGWELRRLTHTRGPYVGAKGDVLSISDVVVMGARQPPGLDGESRVAVGSWRDGKFDFGYIGTLRDGQLSPVKVDATTMKNWIKGNA